ncbi:OB-fold-containig protein [Hymenobacter sp. DG01]|uniref:OB-fold-containig protein n=1 Tax=Hymenobacter sp. DG01 TaxID=2584940 RepID=UPI00111F2DD2|nr:OB-fold-containig protein [Hymenobacter sp. DG01]
MTDLFHAALLPPNLLPTALLVFVLLYWLTVLAGMLDMKTLDLDTTHVFDAGHHGPPTTETGGVVWLNHVLAFFNLGRVPLMMLVSLVVLPLWVGSILTNYYLGNTSFGVGLVLLVPLLPASLLLAKLLTAPLVHLFASLEKNHDAGLRPVGRVCTVLLPTSRERLGQARVPVRQGAPLVLNVRLASPAPELQKGDSALIIDYDEQGRCYLIEAYEVP